MNKSKGMTSIFKNAGRSARRKAGKQSKKTISGANKMMEQMRLWGIVLTILLMVSSCHEKTNGQHTANSKKDHAAITEDSVNKPKVDIKVNRHYDDKGNLIGIDSTYSSFYSNLEGDPLKMDSLMNSFNRYFNRKHPSFFGNEFNTLFFNDSLGYPDFFHRDFFQRRYELNDHYFKDMMQRMDSIKNRFYYEHSKSNRETKDL